MKNSLKIPVLFFILIYANQGLSSLAQQPLYYLTREMWHLSATMLGLIGFLVGIAWYIKPIFGIFIDHFPIKNYRSKYYLYINYITLILLGLYIVIFGLNLFTLILTGILINIAIGFNDVANDTQMCILEKKHNLKGRIQAIQWISLGTAGLFVSLGGAWIAKTFSVHTGYKVAYGIWLLLPILTLYYLKKVYKEVPITQSRAGSNPPKGREGVKPSLCILLKKKFKEAFKNKSFIVGILFIAFLRFSPSFGNALMIRMREQMNIDKMFIGYLGATGTVLGLIGYALYYWKAFKIPMKKLLYFAVLFSGLTSLCYLWIPNKWTIFSYNILFGAFDGIAFLAILAFMARIVPTGSEGLFYALVTSVNNFAARLGGFAGGIIYDKLGYNANVIIAAITTFCCLAFIPYLKLGNKNE